MVFFPSAFGLREKGKHRYSKGKYNPLQPHEAYSLSLIKCLILLKSTCLSICSIIRFERSRGTVFRLVLWNCSIHVRMKFGEKFAEYLHGEQKWPLDKFSHVNYKRLKKVLKSCRRCKHSDASCSSEQEHASGNEIKDQCEVCPLCDQKFFTELMKEASDITGCFCTRISHLFELAVTRGMQSAEVDAVAVPVFQERSTAQAPRENSA